MMAESGKSIVSKDNLDAEEKEMERLQTRSGQKAGISQKVEISQEDVRGHDGTLSSAATMWMCRNGPLVYNKFQSLYFGLKRMGFEDSDEVMGETREEKQKRLKAKWNELSIDVHGSDYLAEAMQAMAKEKEEMRNEMLQWGLPMSFGHPKASSKIRRNNKKCQTNKHIGMIYFAHIYMYLLR